MAEDCLLAKLIERLLWRKQTLRIALSAASNDPSKMSGWRFSCRVADPHPPVV
jgi:hypothetical protein